VIRSLEYQKPGDRNIVKKNGINTASRILSINSVITIFAFVIQMILMALYGSETGNYWILYVLSIVIMVTIAPITQAIIKHSVFAGMSIYAWTCFACVSGMACIDLVLHRTTFPSVLFTLVLGILGLGITAGYSAVIPFSTVCAVMMVISGIAFKNMDGAITALALIAATTMMSSESARVADKLNELEFAVGIYIDAKHGLGQDTTTHRSS